LVKGTQLLAMNIKRVLVIDEESPDTATYIANDLQG